MRARYTSAWAPSPRVSSITAADCILRAMSTWPRFNIASMVMGASRLRNRSRCGLDGGPQRSLDLGGEENGERLLAKLDFFVDVGLLSVARAPLILGTVDQHHCMLVGIPCHLGIIFGIFTRFCFRMNEVGRNVRSLAERDFLAIQLQRPFLVQLFVGRSSDGLLACGRRIRNRGQRRPR